MIWSSFAEKKMKEHSHLFPGIKALLVTSLLEIMGQGVVAAPWLSVTAVLD
jgi:hypothetical protein